MASRCKIHSKMKGLLSDFCPCLALFLFSYSHIIQCVKPSHQLQGCKTDFSILLTKCTCVQCAAHAFKFSLHKCPECWLSYFKRSRYCINILSLCLAWEFRVEFVYSEFVPKLQLETPIPIL